MLSCQSQSTLGPMDVFDYLILLFGTGANDLEPVWQPLIPDQPTKQSKIDPGVPHGTCWPRCLGWRKLRKMKELSKCIWWAEIIRHQHFFIQATTHLFGPPLLSNFLIICSLPMLLVITRHLYGTEHCSTIWCMNFKAILLLAFMLVDLFHRWPEKRFVRSYLYGYVNHLLRGYSLYFLVIGFILACTLLTLTV